MLESYSCLNYGKALALESLKSTEFSTAYSFPRFGTYSTRPIHSPSLQKDWKTVH